MSSLLQTRSEAAVSARKPSAPTSPLPDIDSQDKANPLSAPEYANDIHAYYRRVEPKFRVSPDYMASQVSDLASVSLRRPYPAAPCLLLPLHRNRPTSTRR